MSLRHLLIVFFSVLAASLVILIMFFSLFFDKLDLTFNTHIPEAAPEIKWQAPVTPSNVESPDKKADASKTAESETPEAKPADDRVGFAASRSSFWPKSALVNVPAEIQGPVQTTKEPLVDEEDKDEELIPNLSNLEDSRLSNPPVPVLPSRSTPSQMAKNSKPNSNRFTQLFQND